MITTEPPVWEKDTIKYCKNCARRTYRKPAYIKSGTYVDELSFCDDCWSDILKKINWPIGYAIR